MSSSWHDRGDSSAIVVPGREGRLRVGMDEVAAAANEPCHDTVLVSDAV
eukprot:SAG31_NODE_42132_length_273_cov_0.580460_1_plen_48_part_10